MEDLLYLVHRIPFPPNKGDKIRSFHILKHLSTRYRVHLGTFIDDPKDWEYVDKVKALCAETCIVPLNPTVAKLRSLSGFLHGEALSLPYYANRRLQLWVDTILGARRIDRALVFSSPMAQYLDGHRVARRVIDFVDVDSDKWRQYARSKRWPVSAIYSREARTLLQYERRIAAEFDSSTFVSRAESTMFKRLAPESAAKIRFFNNGVDSDYFSPEHAYENPFPAGVKPIVFTGAMDYWANAEAVDWFAHKIFPVIRARKPGAVFYIVGARPMPQVKSLAAIDGITVTGSVPDVRPYIAHAAVSVAPLRIARGIQNKVLEAMSMGRTVIASPEAAEGIQAVTGRELLVARDEREYVDMVLKQLQTKDKGQIGRAARERVVQRYSWQSGMKQLQDLLDANPSAPAPAKPLPFPTAASKANLVLDGAS
ncbi:TIGR03087 family PEP-CTERM/XrtA system glycosyltransferase [Noviherbaspirillum galbum]|uniref:TIGR03087 family PEP-CTERM/XrtA system glycosyltransferase n=1 Tax=Noviherbaspirillum galbum TaxID=2709383 RepID=A0A6B3ST79_9BURK|nr:TIGR03087 family PEP-CTERM/XrtA system glycosyltransferase [Noviherbaspirillum galbum]NEX64180.1 TIGR03087 family PEP-CTERM/XrtA system glycosyltransferase [Noviherbaspirillum galbum]